MLLGRNVYLGDFMMTAILLWSQDLFIGLSQIAITTDSRYDVLRKALEGIRIEVREY